MMRLDYIFN